MPATNTATNTATTKTTTKRNPPVCLMIALGTAGNLCYCYTQ